MPVHWVIVNLEKGKTRRTRADFGKPLLTMLKNALFSRAKRSLFTVYCDEMQNFVAQASGIETMLSEARKFGVAFVAANQFLEQYPAEIALPSLPSARTSSSNFRAPMPCRFPRRSTAASHWQSG